MSNYALKARPGRLAQVPHFPTLPSVHVETGTNCPKLPREVPAAGPDHLWDLPNTWPMMRYDVRYRRQISPPAAADVQGDFTFGDPFPPSDDCGVGLVQMVLGYKNRFADRFAAINKPLQYVLLVVGVDAANPEIPGQQDVVLLSRNPNDEYYWGSQ